MGGALAYLRSQTAEESLPGRVEEEIAQICAAHGVERWRGKLRIVVPARGQVTMALLHLIQAASQVADLRRLLAPDLRNES